MHANIDFQVADKVAYAPNHSLDQTTLQRQINLPVPSWALVRSIHHDKNGNRYLKTLENFTVFSWKAEKPDHTLIHQPRNIVYRQLHLIPKVPSSYSPTYPHLPTKSALNQSGYDELANDIVPVRQGDSLLLPVLIFNTIADPSRYLETYPPISGFENALIKVMEPIYQDEMAKGFKKTIDQLSDEIKQISKTTATENEDNRLRIKRSLLDKKNSANANYRFRIVDLLNQDEQRLETVARLIYPLAYVKFTGATDTSGVVVDFNCKIKAVQQKNQTEQGEGVCSSSSSEEAEQRRDIDDLIFEVEEANDNDYSVCLATSELDMAFLVTPEESNKETVIQKIIWCINNHLICNSSLRPRPQNHTPSWGRPQDKKWWIDVHDVR